MSQVIKVSKVGINVGTATDPNDFIFDSTLNTFKVITTGTVTGTISAGVIGTINQAHSQSYIPSIAAFSKRQGFNNVLPVGAFEFFPRDDYNFLSATSDGTNLHFEIDNNSSSGGTFDIKYYVFETIL